MVLGKGYQQKTAAFRLTDSVFKSINQKMHAGEIFCDLAEVFNCMNHETFSAKLHLYGIQRIPDGWFRSYLTNRRQVVEGTLPNQLKIFSLTGVHRNIEFHKDHF